MPASEAAMLKSAPQDSGALESSFLELLGKMSTNSITEICLSITAKKYFFWFVKNEALESY